MNKEQNKAFKFYHMIVTSLFFVIIFAAFGSCDSNDPVDPNEPNEPADTTTVVDTTTVLNAPIIQTPTPVIHLADNLDEPDQLGWCIDTRGNGFNENLHAHSCKASGGDVQFTYDEATRQLCSAEFGGFCIEMSGGPVEGMSLILVTSDANSSDQKFIYNEDSGEFRPEADTNLCLAVGSTSSAAGIYVSRTLTLERSSEIDEGRKKWVILE